MESIIKVIVYSNEYNKDKKYYNKGDKDKKPVKEKEKEKKKVKKEKKEEVKKVVIKGTGAKSLKELLG